MRGRRQASTPKSGKVSGVNCKARTATKKVNTFSYLLEIPFTLKNQTFSFAQPTNTTHRHSNSLSWTRACDRSPSTPELLPTSFTVHHSPPCLPRNRGQSGQKINRFPSSKFHQPGRQLQRSSIGLRGSLRHLRELIIISLLSKHPLLFVPLHLSLSVHSLKDLTALLSGIPATRTWLKTLKTLKTLIRMVVLVLL